MTDDLEQLLAAKVEDAPWCPACEGESTYLGQLGRLLWFRCRSCGIDFNVKEQS